MKQHERAVSVPVPVLAGWGWRQGDKRIAENSGKTAASEGSGGAVLVLSSLKAL